MQRTWVIVVASLCLIVPAFSAGQTIDRDAERRLRDQLMRQEQQLDALERALDEQRRALADLRALVTNGRPDTAAGASVEAGASMPGGARVVPASVLEKPVAVSAPVALRASTTIADDEPAATVELQSTGLAQTGEPPRANPTQEVAAEQPEGPSLAVGPARLRIGGYLGLTGISRSTNAGGGPGTSFASIPFADRVPGNVSEARLSAQSSRISIRVDADYPEPRPRFERLSGYFEMDFNGESPGTVAVTSGGVGFRLRHAFAEVRYRNSFVLAAGQAFSLMTPVKDQLSIWPSDSELSQAVDTNYLAGLIWDRAPQLRLAWRPSTRFNWAVSLENPEQQIGNALVRLPGCCADDIAAQYNTGSNELRTPNLMPDVVTRVALNPTRQFHFDVGGVVRVLRHTVQPYDHDFKQTTGGGSANLRLDATDRTRILLQAAAGSGLGRYIGGLVPDVAFRSDGSIGAIGTTSWIAGVEHRLRSALSLAGYYSGVRSNHTFYIDADGSYLGYGYPGSPSSNNRRIREFTGTASYQIATTRDRGSAQLNMQASWLTREPWSKGTGLDTADMFMFFAQVRYNLP